MALKGSNNGDDVYQIVGGLPRGGSFTGSARLSREGPPTLMILFVISILPIPFRYSFWLLVFTCLYLKKNDII